MAEVDVGGTTRDRDRAPNSAQVLTYPQTGRIVLRDGAQLWTATSAELGAVFDVPSMAGEALAVGRRGGLPAAPERAIEVMVPRRDTLAHPGDRRTRRPRLLLPLGGTDRPATGRGQPVGQRPGRRGPSRSDRTSARHDVEPGGRVARPDDDARRQRRRIRPRKPPQILDVTATSQRRPVDPEPAADPDGRRAPGRGCSTPRRWPR